MPPAQKNPISISLGFQPGLSIKHLFNDSLPISETRFLQDVWAFRCCVCVCFYYQYYDYWRNKRNAERSLYLG